MPCKPIRRKYSKNEVILPSDRRGSMACHAVPRVMMYQGDARVHLEAEAILVRGLRWCRTEVWNNGCFVRLGRCGNCDLTSHCSLLLLGRYEWGASPLLFCTVIWYLTRRPGCYMSHMSATGSTKFMKGSVDGGVYYRIHEREQLSFGKICFYGVRTH